MSLVQAVANDNGAGATTVACTIASSTAGNCLIVVVGVYADTVTGVTDNLSQTYTPAYTPGSDHVTPGVWTCPNTASGVTTITATFSSSHGSVIFGIEESGIVTSSPVDQHKEAAFATVTVWDTTAATTTTQENSIGYASICAADGSNSSFAADAGWTPVSGTGITSGHHGNTTEGDDCFVARREYTTTGAYSATGTCTAATVAPTIVILKQAAAGPAPRIVTPTTSVSMGR
jgi:hypothetical protein